MNLKLQVPITKDKSIFIDLNNIRQSIQELEKEDEISIEYFDEVSENMPINENNSKFNIIMREESQRSSQNILDSMTINNIIVHKLFILEDNNYNDNLMYRLTIGFADINSEFNDIDKRDTNIIVDGVK